MESSIAAAIDQEGEFGPFHETQEDSKKQSLRQVIVSCMIGNALEWYDFALYGYLASVIGQLFFPSTDPFASLLATFGVFAAGFIMRPLGAIVFGHLGDKVGRKEALLWSIYLMAIPTAIIGVLPTYEQIGWFSPLLLTVVRLFQGFSMGGEFTGSMIFIVEHSKSHQRGFAGSWAPFSLLLGIIAGSGVAAFICASVTEEQLYTWGWRIPFLLSILGSVVGSYMRRSLTDPESFAQAKKQRKGKHSTPLKELFTHHWQKVLTVLMIDMIVAIGFYVIVIFINTYLSSILEHSKSSALWINTVSMAVFALIIPFSGALSDRIGRKPLLLSGTIGLALFSYPLFLGLATDGFWIPLISQALLALLMGLTFAVIPATLVEIFPASVRYSGLSIAHNLSMTFFGGTAPFVVTGLIKLSGDKLAPSFYLIVAAALSIIAMSSLKESYKKSID